MSNRHRHADLIHAWAEGAEIEYKPVDVSIWKDCGDLEPSWGNDFFEYRIKPEKKPDVVKYVAFDMVQGTMMRYNRPEHATEFERKCGLLRIVMDGETGKLIKAEVL